MAETFGASTTLAVFDSEGRPENVNYTYFISPLIRGVQDIYTQITEISGDFKTALIAWLADAANGITEMIAGTFRAKDMLCINDTCVTEEQLQELLAGVNASSQNDQAPISNDQSSTKFQ